MYRNNVFKLLLEFLASEEIIYSLLGASDDFPNIVGDIDLVVSNSAFEKLDSIVFEFCSRNNLIVSQKFVHESSACFYVLSFFNAEENSYSHVEVDFCSDYKRLGRLYFTAAKLLQNREYVKEKGYWKLNDVYSFVYYLVKKIDKGSLDESQFKQLLQCWHSDSPSILTELQHSFGNESIKIISESFHSGNFDLLQGSLAQIKRDLQIKNPKRLKNVLLEKLRLARRVFNTTGFMVCVLGRDGSGKTTFNNGLTKSLELCFRNTSRFHLYPGFIFKEDSNAEPGDFTKPHEQVRRNKFMSLLKLSLFFVEYSFGYMVKILPKKIKSNLILFDRYFIDVLADPVRYRDSNNKYLVKFVHYLIAKPDVWIILDVPTEVLMERKNELSFELSESLRKKYLELKNFLPNSILINTENNLTDCVNEASKFILVKMGKKISDK